MSDPFKDGIVRRDYLPDGVVTTPVLFNGEVEQLYTAFEQRFLEKYPVHPRETQEERAEWLAKMVMEGKK